MLVPYKEFTDGKYKEFRDVMMDTLRYRCLLKKETVAKYFDNQHGMNELRRAFIDATYSKTYNYEMLEFRGDRELNLSVVEYIEEKFPQFTTTKIPDKMKANISSGKYLGILARKFGYDKFSIYGDEMKEKMESERYKGHVERCEDCMKMYENNMEALCGAISKTLYQATKNAGVGHQACHNFIYSMLDTMDIPTTYDQIHDAVSRLKAIFDRKGWNKNKECSMEKNGKCLQIYDIDETSINKYKHEAKNAGWPLKKEILNMEYGFISFAYACVKSGSTYRTLLAVETDYIKMDAKQKAAEEAIKQLDKRFGIRYDGENFY